MEQRKGRKARLDQLRATLDSLATLAFIATCGVLIWALTGDRSRPTVSAASVRASRPPEPRPPSEPLSIDGALLEGSNGARVVLIEYSDFQCPYCGRFARETLPKLDQEYLTPGKVQLAFRHLPLPMHPFAQKAAEAVECAGRQGKFRQMHDKLFEQSQALDDASLQKAAEAIGVDRSKFESCFNGQAAEKVRQDAASAREFAVDGTPTFFAGIRQPDGKIKVVERIPGVPPIAQMEAILNRLLKGSD